MALDDKIINLDINKTNMLNLTAKQYDTTNARSFTFRLLKDGQVFDLTGLTVRIGGAKADGKTIFNDVTIVDSKNGLVRVDLTTQMQTVAGNLNLELIIMQNDARLSTVPFGINIIKSATNLHDVASSSELDALNNALYKVDSVYSKDDIDKFKWSMSNMGQDIKEAMTGGSVAVVGENAVNTINLVDGAVTNEKMSYINTNHEIIQFLDSFDINIESPDGEGYMKGVTITIKPSLWIYFTNGKSLALMGEKTDSLPDDVLVNGQYKFSLKHNDILTYSCRDNIINIKNSGDTYDLKADEFLLANCNSGRCNSGIFKGIFDSLCLKKMQSYNIPNIKNNLSELLLNNIYAYNSNNEISFEQDGNNVLFYTSMINVRNKLMLNFGWDNIKTLFADNIVTINGQEKLKIPADHALVLNKNTNNLELVGYTAIENYHYPLLITVDGIIRGGELAKYDIRNKINSIDQRIDTINSNVKKDNIPSYWNDALNNAITRIRALQDGSGRYCTSFVFVTDLHFTDNAGKSGALIEKIMKECDIHTLICGGDLVNNDAATKRDFALSCIREFRQLYKNVEKDMLVSLGNHDDNTITQKYSESIDENTMYSELFRYTDNSFEIGEDGTYYYKDDKFNKIRYITLNSIDVPINKVGNDGLEFRGQWDYLFRQTQVEWLINKALNVPDQTWSIVICSHVPPDATIPASDNAIHNVEAVLCVLKAFKEKTAFSYQANLGDKHMKMDISGDFTGKGGNIICWLSGHTHYDYIGKVPNSSDIQLVVTLNDSLQVEKGMPQKVRGTTTEQAFDIFTVVPCERKVFITRVGAGENREFTY